uniref:NADH-ubiquinone oxidoreductase chain 2 n=1 Tax=Agrilus discalis TaxID=3013958 RepID=A0A9E9JLQ6_9COLE|nr:NADH dehydrogenase subunit 2 [Agrilus discalis]WAP90831.1 NADH dehydrogenase subunit 2 [Agrilus discalis]
MKQIYKNMFLVTLVLGTLISISANSWVVVWIGLEMNMLSIIPLISNSTKAQSTEASIKYFIIQAMASMILLIGCMMNTIKMNSPSNFIMEELPSLMVTSSLLTKMGAAPFHFWFPEVMEGLDWFNALVLLTWQKIAPMTMMMYIKTNEKLLFTVILFSIIISGVMGINQNSLRKILTYSSINHVGWMLTTILFLEEIWMFYFTIYSIMNIVMIWMLKKYNISSISQIMMMSKFNPQLKTFFMLNFLSLGGIPPMIGFLPKWFTIQILVNNQMYTMAFIMIVTTLITLYFYMRMVMNPFLGSISMPSNILISQQFKIKKLLILNCIIFMSLLFSTMMLNWI